MYVRTGSNKLLILHLLCLRAIRAHGTGNIPEKTAVSFFYLFPRLFLFSFSFFFSFFYLPPSSHSLGFTTLLGTVSLSCLLSVYNLLSVFYLLLPYLVSCSSCLFTCPQLGSYYYYGGKIRGHLTSVVVRPATPWKTLPIDPTVWSVVRSSICITLIMIAINL